MTEESVPEWIRYQVGSPSTEPNWTNTNCQLLTAASHVAHLDAALRIVEEGKIRAGLVYDESKLRTRRILVVWFSPNDWVQGFRYGNVRFTFNWAPLVRDRKYYWVESVPHSPPGGRILVTSKDYTSELEEYDPTLGDGPWWYDVANDRHYWNGNFCLEIMIEDDLTVAESGEVDFVNHHPNGCSVDWRTCTTRGLKRAEASARFLAALVAQGIDAAALKFTQDELGSTLPTSTLQDAWSKLGADLSKVGGATHHGQAVSRPTSLVIARAILASYAQSRQVDIGHLAGLFRSTDSMIQTCAEVIASHFQIDDWHLLFPLQFRPGEVI